MPDKVVHPLDAALEFNQKDGQLTGHTSPAYMNMIGPFGGITAAAMLKAIMVHPDVLGEPITLTVNFAAAVQDGPFVLDAKAVRTGRSTQHWFVSMLQNDEVVTSATAVFATRRKTWGTTDLPFPELPADMQTIDQSMMPPWARNYRFQFAQGIGPLTPNGKETSESIQMVRDEPPRPLDFVSLTAISDIFPPRVFIRRPKFVPAGTVSITIYYHADGEALNAHGDNELIGHARANRFYDRYFDQSAEIWTPSGDLLVTTTQIVYFKE
ncbi:MAG: thioesterase family protein [Chloroflexota bacterium]